MRAQALHDTGTLSHTCTCPSDGAVALAEASWQKSNGKIHAQCWRLPGLLVAQSWADPAVLGFTLHSSLLQGTAFQGFVSDSSIIPKSSSTCFPSVVSPCCTSTSPVPPCHCLWQTQSCIQPFSSPVFHGFWCKITLAQLGLPPPLMLCPMGVW